MSTIVLDCQKCGGTLTITEELEVFKCEFCGTPYMVERSAGTTRIILLEQRVGHLEDRQVLLKEGVVALSQINEVKAELERKEKELQDATDKGGIFSSLAWGAVLTLGLGTCSVASLSWAAESGRSMSGFLGSVGLFTGLGALLFVGVFIWALVVRPRWIAQMRTNVENLRSKLAQLERSVSDASS